MVWTIDALLAVGHGVHTLSPAPPIAVTVARVAAAGWDPMVVDGRSVLDKDSLLIAVAQGAAFPDWFGHNLDALADCLGDLSWRPGNKHALVWTHGDRLALLPPVVGNAVLGVFDEAAGEGSPSNLLVLLLGASDTMLTPRDVEGRE